MRELEPVKVKQEDIDKEIAKFITANPLLTGSRPWTSKESYFLQKTYGKTPTKAIAKHLNRNISSIQNKAKALGLMGEIIR